MWHAASQLIIQCCTIKTKPIKYATHSISPLTVKSAHPGDNISNSAAGLASSPFFCPFIADFFSPTIFPRFAFTLLLRSYNCKTLNASSHCFWNVCQVSITNRTLSTAALHNNSNLYILNLRVTRSIECVDVVMKKKDQTVGKNQIAQSFQV